MTVYVLLDALFDCILDLSSLCPISFQVTVKPAASSHLEKDHASSVGSPRGAKAESQKLLSRPPKDSESSSHTLKPGPSSTSTSVSSANKAAVALGSGTFPRPAPVSSSSALVVPPKDFSAGASSGGGLRQKTVGALDPAKCEQKKFGSNADPLLLDKVTFTYILCAFVVLMKLTFPFLLCRLVENLQLFQSCYLKSLWLLETKRQSHL